MLRRTSLPGSAGTSLTTPVTSPLALTCTVRTPRTPCSTLSYWYSTPALPTVSPDW